MSEEKKNDELKETAPVDKFKKREEVKKEDLKSSLIAGGIVGSVLGLILGIIGATEAFWLFFVLFIPSLLLGLGLGLAISFSNRKNINRSFCPSCGEQYDYDRDIVWEVSSEEEKTNAVVANVDVECTCNKCGELVEFSVRQTTASRDPKTGHIKHYNIKNSMKKYFFCSKTKKRFFNIF